MSSGLPEGLPAAASGTVPPGAVPSPLGTTLPALSLPGNVLGLGVAGVITVWTWRRGGWWRVISVLSAFGALNFIGRIERQI
jgi:hypothetical protein